MSLSVSVSPYWTPALTLRCLPSHGVKETTTFSLFVLIVGQLYYSTGLLILGQKAAPLVGRVRKISAGSRSRRRRVRRRRGRRKKKTKTKTKTKT